MPYSGGVYQLQYIDIVTALHAVCLHAADNGAKMQLTVAYANPQ